MLIISKGVVMNKAKFKVIKTFNYKGSTYTNGTILNILYSKVNILGLHYNIENLGWVNLENPIMNNLVRIWV